MKNFDFNQLFVLDLANNHQGSVEHARSIIKSHADVVKRNGIRASCKFQFRDLDTFIHPKELENKQNKHIKRFLSTRLSSSDFATLTETVRNSGLVTMATPFDESSVDLIEKLDIEIIKIASCSATDKPLLQRVARARRPVIASTAGLNISQIDSLVAFLESKNIHFALMHCIAIYPTDVENLRLNQIDLLKSRYPSIPIGFSTHESPTLTSAIMIAYAKGATLFERHIGLPLESQPLNHYSSNPTELDQWLQAYRHAVQACGGEGRSPSPKEEIESLQSLTRGVYARRHIAKGSQITTDDLYFAMPLLPGFLSANHLTLPLLASKDYEVNEPIEHVKTEANNHPERVVTDILIQTKGILNTARIHIGKESSVEISHHFGLERFREFGAIIVTCVNRSYTKKLVIQLPRQKHPYHHHKIKEETFQLLYGDLEVEINGHRHRLSVGDTVLVPPGAWHKFHTLDGCVFEEISTTHLDNDSYYEDERIVQLGRHERKTLVPNWTQALKAFQ
jgi:sialic acid synthase SpsE/mannose-6-phosphate isomerase-like protein (cupin superfamily)